jgi:hypothetical protein
MNAVTDEPLALMIAWRAKSEHRMRSRVRLNRER